ncbi:hypothetical protein O4J56_02735 [Nocardiopsis sp. RSe5-2]|uniref:DUF6879 domain-containing protein n=1 Tax=Nocardiopsis endophytica TaxID=3018445 RepID=A0ABT4TXX8_9ACTN|nr:DUF6879 family protein [Nocardiopsis endophytica]MDA2809545.1 hypothetical protein [Nocardiopsis endophytica]
MSVSEFREVFDSFEHQMFRLESLDHYIAENEREPLERFRAGLAQDPAWRRPWAGTIAAINARGASIGRVHVVTEPLTEYVTFEMTCAYPASVQAGEDVRILPRSTAERLGVPCEDFWLLDDTRTASMAYDEDGHWLHVDLTDDPQVVQEHVRLRELVRAEATPLFDYLSGAGMEPAPGSLLTPQEQQ